jgi:stage II sporulation protein AB (anti-sigma F factor)
MNQEVLHDDNFESEIKEYDNEMDIEFDSLSKNESFARTVVAAFVSQLNPTLEELADIKTAVSEAVTNSIIHGYKDINGKIHLRCGIKDLWVEIEVIDQGVGIEDVERAMEPLYTSCPELERSGMGFAFMSAFMDELQVISKRNVGTTIKMRKRIGTT